MEIYLPIAEMSQSVPTLLILGLIVGFLSGMLGVGGGFLLTPLLIFIGVPQAVAVGSSANELVGVSAAGLVGPLRRGQIDFVMASVVGAGGVLGAFGGTTAFAALRRLGQIELVVSLGYVVLLGSIGTLMLIESVGVLLRAPSAASGQADAATRRPHLHSWAQRLPLKLRFQRSKLYISVLPPMALGVVLGLLSALLGIGGSFLAVPAMIYLLRMPATVVTGTSLLQTAIIASAVTIFHSRFNHSVDLLLALLLLAGAWIGVQLGGIVGARARGDHLRVALSALILLVGGKLLYDLTASPPALYSVTRTL